MVGTAVMTIYVDVKGQNKGESINYFQYPTNTEWAVMKQKKVVKFYNL